MSSTTPLDDALSIDVNVLVNLLKRNWCAQSRALYFQRTSMVVRSIQRHQVAELRQRLHELQQSLEKLNQQRKRHKSRLLKDEAWVAGVKDETRQSESLELQALKQNLEEIQKTLTKGLPEILSRTEHASSALLIEISRGFFLPLCTVAIAALARVRVLLMRLGREGMRDLQTCWQEWHALQSTETNTLPIQPLSGQLVEWTMNSFVEQQGTNSQLADMQRRARDKTRISMGLHMATKTNEKHLATSDAKSDESTTEGYKRQEDDQLEAESSSIDDSRKVQEDLDLGENIEICGTSGASHPASMPVSRNRTDDRIASEQVHDSNMEFVRQLQSTKAGIDDVPKAKKRRKGSKERKAKDKESKKKKKRKRQSKKKDVFDQIFGDQKVV